jgi:hypothetical protein
MVIAYITSAAKPVTTHSLGIGNQAALQNLWDAYEEKDRRILVDQLCAIDAADLCVQKLGPYQERQTRIELTYLAALGQELDHYLEAVRTLVQTEIRLGIRSLLPRDQDTLQSVENHRSRVEAIYDRLLAHLLRSEPPNSELPSLWAEYLEFSLDENAAALSNVEESKLDWFGIALADRDTLIERLQCINAASLCEEASFAASEELRKKDADIQAQIAVHEIHVKDIESEVQAVKDLRTLEKAVTTQEMVIRDEDLIQRLLRM